MKARQLPQLARLALALPAHLRHPITPEQAATRLGRQLANRHENFLTVARRMIYENPVSPYRRLLAWAGCDFADLRQSVQAHGLDRTLERLHAAGVHLTLEEFKLQTPIRRPGLTLEPRETDFDSPLLAGDGIAGTTSGSRARVTRVLYDWEFIAEEAAHEAVLYAHHGVLDAPLALWYPAPPGVAGVHNLLMNLKLGRPPAKWFSQIDPVTSPMPGWHRWALRGIRWSGRTAGLNVPRPEFADLAQADTVLDWLRQSGTGVLRTFASSAVRLAQRARERGIDLRGATIFTGGEPLTEARRRFIESAGANVFPRYVATEPGLIAAACARRARSDDMHVYVDRIAVIQGPERLLFTTLSPHAGKVLLNVDLGDAGELTTRPCDCEFGRLGFDVHVARVSSQQRLTVEGMTVLASELEAILNAIIAPAGGSPDSYQCRQTPDERGLSRLVIAVSPDVGNLDEQSFVESVYQGLRARGPGLAVAAAIWKQAGAIQVVREQPRLSRGCKLSPLARAP